MVDLHWFESLLFVVAFAIGVEFTIIFKIGEFLLQGGCTH